jgi:hypothetical protein
LQHDFLEKAKEYAKRPEDDDKKKKLWMMVIRQPFLILDCHASAIKER